MCYVFYAIYFNNKIVYVVHLMVYIVQQQNCAVHLTIYISITKLRVLCILRCMLQYQNCVCCVSYVIYGSLKKPCTMCIVDIYCTSYDIYFNNKIVCVLYILQCVEYHTIYIVHLTIYMTYIMHLLRCWG